MFWRILLYILHHTLPVTFISVDDSTLFSALDLCPWEPSGGFWWYCLFWSRFALHICYMFFSNFHSALWNIARQCKDFVVGCLYCCSYSSYRFFGLVSSFWSSSCWVPKQGTCILLRLCKCSSSCCNSSGLEHMVLALWWRVPITLFSLLYSLLKCKWILLILCGNI